MRKIQNNEDLVRDLMNYSPYGGLGQAFVVYAIREYADKIAVADPASVEGLISGEAWVGIAKDVKARCDAFYNRHNSGQSEIEIESEENDDA